MTDSIRMTYPTALVILALDCNYRYGFDIADATGLRGGTVYPILRRLEALKIVAGDWEDVEVSREQRRPPRRYYRLLDSARPIVAEARERYPFVPLAGRGTEASS
jgi:DNA-binding PadR family transcriptional regulator